MTVGILWDLDGTLLDTLADLSDAVNYALAQFGFPPRSIQQVRSFVGNGAARLIERALPESSGIDPLQVLAVFQSHYRAHAQDKTAAYPGIVRALTALGRHYPMAIVSNKPDAAVKLLCAEFFPGIYARGESADCPRKPAPDMVHSAMQTLGIEKCIYVGDSEVDIRTAQNAGVPCLSVTWGFRTKQELAQAGAAHFCDDPCALAQTLQTMIKPLINHEV